MKKSGIVYLIIIAILMTMCTAQKPAMREVPTREFEQPIYAIPTGTVEEMGYKGDLKPTFYYVEGLKWSSLSENHTAASHFFDKAIETDSTHSPSYFAAANNIAPLDPELALEYSRKANSLDTANVWYRTQLGSLLIRNHRYQEAMQTYTQLLQDAPNNPDNYRMLAALYEANQQPYAAIALLDSAEIKFGLMEELSGFKRELYIKLKLWDRAINTSQMLVNEYPYQYENYLILGDLYMARGNDSLALVNFTKALEFNPDGVDVLLGFANYYRNKDDLVNFFDTTRKILQSNELDFAQKILLFNDITRDKNFYAANYFPISGLALTMMLKHPHSYEIVDLYAGNLLLGGQTEEGLNIYKAYISDTTSIVEPYNIILSGEAYLGRLDSVNKYSLLAINKFPAEPELYLRRGSALAYMGHHQEALDTYKQALNVAQTDSMKSVIYCYIGDVQHLKGNNRQSYKSYDKALELSPDNILALNNYAYFLSVEGKQLDKALGMASRVMELEPENPTYIDTYGWILYKQGRYQEAKEALRQAVSLDSTANKELLAHYGDIFYELGEYFMAKYYWEKALGAGYDDDEISQRMKKLEGK